VPALTAQHHPACYPSEGAAALAFFERALKEAEVVAEPIGAGLIVPHIDFRVNLPIYAQAFRPLLDLPLADSYLILGVGHRSRVEWNLDRRDYATPLGLSPCDTAWIDQLAGGDDRFFRHPDAHAGEHSIEFPLVWLQAIHALRGAPAPKFAPVLCGAMHGYVEERVGWPALAAFHALAERLGPDFAAPNPARRVIVSIDGCHLGPRFQHPFRVDKKILADTAQWEESLWGEVAHGEVRRFLDWMRREGNDRYFDGVGALALVLAAGAGRLHPRRDTYAQWLSRHDASAVTFSAGRLLLAV
jgi:predicted class III extradiol MEMO1 family dioxygenase